ncbi:MAG: 5-bromo-4-chloroindolyl phosphate hydrolysis family protein [Oscillospiraceae bacterium]|jgi:hypothetical protein|nr:5-bromo-4-chloroindolyl phosphate hydrolysis family protein [Oscillospiraceae bacterium]
MGKNVSGAIRMPRGAVNAPDKSVRRVRRNSPLPYLVAGLAALLYGLNTPLYTMGGYLRLAILALIVYWIARIFWRPRMVEVQAPPDSGDASADELIREARLAVTRIRALNDAIADPALSRVIDHIEGCAGEMLLRIEEKPELQNQLRTFLRYYLPTTVKILDARAELEPGKGSTSKLAFETRARAERMLEQIDKAFIKQNDALEKNRYLDVQVEMDVLDGMLRSNGLTAGGND